MPITTINYPWFITYKFINKNPNQFHMAASFPSLITATSCSLADQSCDAQPLYFTMPQLPRTPPRPPLPRRPKARN
jgi:hypothetical protein